MPPPAYPLLAALDPARCVVVEACAGSGKTWLLVSRMIRLLLAGADPSELLAITFTRKAAKEMRSRLDEWLTDLALLPDDQAVAFLAQRGLSEAAARAALPRARGLLESVLSSRPGPMITTFHGWFFHLLAHAPLTLRLPGAVVEQIALLREEAWLEFTRSLGRQRGSPAEQAFAELAGEMPLGTLRALLHAVLEQRAEWWAAGRAESDPVAGACAALEACLGVDEGRDVVAELFARPGLAGDCRTYHFLVARNGEAGLKGDVERAVLLQQALDSLSFDLLRAGLLTQKDTPLVRKPGKELDKRLGPADAARYLGLHQSLAAQVQAAVHQLAEQRALRLNRLGLIAGQVFIETYQRLKEARGGLDFTDAELETARLLEDEAAAAAVFMKLDARWKHLLLDEFQDTNPLQWRILRAWLEAYGEDAARPTVFLVGDPKQSIYRFRRAEPRLFPAAARWLAERYAAPWLPHNETRRCAPRVVAWVNAAFCERADYPVFAEHTAHRHGLPGWCELHAAEAGDGTGVAAIPFRNPLTTPPPYTPHKRRHEAAWVAARIREVVGHLRIEAEGGRPARYGDITVLYAKRADLEVFEDAFKQAGIPFVTDRRGELLATLEARDLTALLEVLLSPFDDLALAHALKSPLFGFGDPDLQHLAAAAGPWWERLSAWAAMPETPAHVRRAADLLDAWRPLAGRVPVHDLLDRIFHQAGVMERYAGAVPAAMATTVLSNLAGFLALSLSLSGGRYPSLPRFLDELRQLREKAGQDGPDEPPNSLGDALRMLTIHSAKGLESPIVFLIKTDASDGKDDNLGVLIDWPPEADRPAHFSLYGPREWRGPGRDGLFAQDREQAARERLNLLYVAMTRARQALFVSGVAAPEAEPEAAGANWLALLSSALAKADLAPLPEMAWSAAAPAPPAPDATGQAMAADIPAIGNRREPASREAALGIRLHAWLEYLTVGQEEAAIRARLGMDEAEAASVSSLARSILATPELAAAFDPAGHLDAHNEMEFMDPEGRLFRIDRLVEFEDCVWLLDYKSGGLDEPDLALRAAPHLAQIAGYCRAARALYPGKTVRAALVFADGRVHWVG